MRAITSTPQTSEWRFRRADGTAKANPIVGRDGISRVIHAFVAGFPTFRRTPHRMRRPATLLACMLLAPLPYFATGATELPALPAHVPAAWVHFDSPLWDIAREGLPFRLTLALPSPSDPVTRALQAAEARWTFSVGYARIYNSYDPTTGIFKNPGGHAALVSGGRQWRWRLPDFAGAFTPQFAMELGVHAATRRFPADGTCFNGKLIAGLEWIFRDNQPDEWSVGVMWQHFSNANIFSRNAGYDALALRFGRRL